MPNSHKSKSKAFYTDLRDKKLFQLIFANHQQIIRSLRWLIIEAFWRYFSNCHESDRLQMKAIVYLRQ